MGVSILEVRDLRCELGGRPVLDGDLDPFVEAYLKSSSKNK